MAKIYDITPFISETTPVWPGDVPFSCKKKNFELPSKKTMSLSSFCTTAHIGAHADAPSHFIEDGSSLEMVSLDHFLGICQVIHLDLEKATAAKVADLCPILQPRVLFATGSFSYDAPFRKDFAALSCEVVELLHQKNVITVGIDTPSMSKQS